MQKVSLIGQGQFLSLCKRIPTLLSTQRKPLMGIGILGVMLIHFVIWGAVPYWFLRLAFSLGHIVYTNGFLLLSGFGLYYSFSKDNNLINYYKKRLFRVVIPFLLIASPFYLAYLFSGIDSFEVFLLKTSALHFFIAGNDCGMWYISMTLLLYILFPVFYYLLFNKQDSILIRFCFLYLISIVIVYSIAKISPEYYEKVSIGLPKSTTFIIGIALGYVSIHPNNLEKSSFILYLLAFGFLFTGYYKLKNADSFFLPYYEDFARTITISIVGIVLDMLTQKGWMVKGRKCISWIGEYSLELYILHMMLLNAITTFAQSFYLEHQNISILIGSFLPSFILCKPLHNWIARIKAKE